MLDLALVHSSAIAWVVKQFLSGLHTCFSALLPCFGGLHTCFSGLLPGVRGIHPGASLIRPGFLRVRIGVRRRASGNAGESSRARDNFREWGPNSLGWVHQTLRVGDESGYSGWMTSYSFRAPDSTFPVPMGVRNSLLE